MVNRDFYQSIPPEFQEASDYYDSQLSKFLNDGLEGKFAAIRGSRLVDTGPDRLQLARRIKERYPSHFVLIKEVRRDEPLYVCFDSPEIIL